MNATTGIEWTDTTWNPTTGCTRVSEGCRNCYAFQLHDQRHAAHKAGKKVPPQYAKPFKELQLFENRLTDPLSWKKPRRVFVNSMSDLFHKDIPDEFLDRVFAVMGLSGQHTFQVLTKRPERMAEYVNRLAKSVEPLERAARGLGYTFKFVTDAGRTLGLLPFPLPNVWIGVSVEDQQRADERIPLLLQTPAAVRFLSCEPLLGPVQLAGKRRWMEPGFETEREVDAFDGTIAIPDCDFNAGPIGWVIVGGESGPGARAFLVEWAESLRDQCKAAGVPYFLKQLGSEPRRLTGTGVAEVLTLKDRKGGDLAEFPPELRIRQFPGRPAHA